MRLEDNRVEVSRVERWALVLVLLCTLALIPRAWADVEMKDGSFHVEL